MHTDRKLPDTHGYAYSQQKRDIKAVLKRADPIHRERIIELNRNSIEFLIPMGIDEFNYLYANALVFEIAFVDDEPVGFIIALGDSLLDYDLKAYRYFSEHFEGFMYIDRVVVAHEFRGQGIAELLYKAVFNYARYQKAVTIAAAIETLPYNAPSLNLHKKLGFSVIGDELIRGGEIKVSYHTLILS